jgi:hypothetical protein
VMRDLVVLFIHLIATLARLLGPGGARSIVSTACCSHPIAVGSPARKDRVQNSSMRSSK